MKQKMTSISDFIIVYLYQNYKNMWNKRTGSTGKQARRFFKDLLQPSTLKHLMIMCLDARKRHTKAVGIYHSDTHAMWKRFDNFVKRATPMFEGIFIDPLDNGIPSSFKESLLKPKTKAVKYQ